MARFIVRYVGTGPRPAADVQRIRTAEELTVLDDSSSRMLLVEANEERVKEVVGSMPGWIWSPERMIRLPSPRPKPRRGPKG